MTEPVGTEPGEQDDPARLAQMENDVQTPSPSRTGVYIAAGAILLVGILLARLLGPVLSGEDPGPKTVEMPQPKTEGLDRESVRTLQAAYETAVLTPAEASAWGKLGMNYYAHEVIPEALTCFEQAEKLDPREPRWPYLLGMIIAETNTAAGLTGIEKAVELEPGNHDFRLRMAEFLFTLNRIAESRKQFENVGEKDSANPRVWLGLARLEFSEERWVECRKLGEKALSLAPARPDIVELLSQACFRSGDRDAAQRYADALTRLQGASAVWSDEYLVEVMTLRSGSQALLGQADQLAASNKVQESLQLMERVVRMDPENPEGFIQFTRALLNSGNLPIAARVVADGVQQHPDNAELLFLHAVVLANVNQLGQAVETLRKVVKLKPDYAEAYFVMGKVLASLGKPQEAITALSDALRYEPAFEPAREALDQLKKR